MGIDNGTDRPDADTQPWWPVRPQPEPPRLSILHLMVWTACAAVYFSFFRICQNALEPLGGTSGLASQKVPWLVFGVGRATALAGLVLLVARRLRGVPFLKHPGEKLWALAGLSAVFALVRQALLIVVLSRVSEFPGSAYALAISLTSALTTLVMLALYVWAAVASKGWHWRVYFIAAVLLPVAAALLGALLAVRIRQPEAVFVPAGAAYIVNAGILLRAGIVDHRRRIRYPWSHWVGVALELWSALGVVVFVAIAAINR